MGETMNDGVAADDEDVVIEELSKDASSGTKPPKPDESDVEVEEEGEQPEKTSTEKELEKIEEEKKKMTPAEKLERSSQWKSDGNTLFKSGQLADAADAYYHAILYCRELTQNPQFYPKLGHNEEQRQVAKELSASVFTNLALVQLKHGDQFVPGHPDRPKVYTEAARSASEALKHQPGNVKALFRRALANASLAKLQSKNEEAQKLCTEAKTDLLKVVELDASNREARTELKAVQEQLKVLKKEELASERREFSFASTLSALSSKVKDLLPDGSVRKKQVVTAGDGGVWFCEDWLAPGGATKCVVEVRFRMVSSGGAEGQEQSSSASPVKLSFILGDSDMHSGILPALRSMTLGEVAEFALAPSRVNATGSLAKLLPDPKGETSVWELALLKFTIWEDVDRNGERLRKIHNEGWGAGFPQALSEVHIHWRVHGPDGTLIYSSRHTINMGQQGGLQPVEDEDKPAPCYVLGESLWEPLAILCRSLRQGGVGELRLRRAPELPADEGKDVVAQIARLHTKKLTGDGLRHCLVRAELERVVQPLSGPEDARWEGLASIVQERFHAEHLLQKGQEATALARLTRVVSWAESLPSAEVAAVAADLAAARTAIGWILISRAAPVLDSGTVTSALLAAARKDIEHAEEHLAWLEQNRPDHVGSHLLRAKILVAQDDDFAGAIEHLKKAQQLDPTDPRVQEELKKVKVELRKQEEAASRAKVTEIRDRLKRARSEPGQSQESTVLSLLQDLAGTKVSWETVMETRIGTELKSCQEECGEEVRRLCLEILAKLKDESKEQRPMWDS